MRGMKELLPLLVVAVIVAIILFSWLRSGAQFIAKSYLAGKPMGMGVASPMPSPPVPPDAHSRLRQLSLALQMYLADYDMKLPPMQNSLALEKVLMPYVKWRDAFIDPLSGTRFEGNASLSFRSLNTIPNPGDIVVFYQQKPIPQVKKRLVVFLNGHIKSVDEQEWQRLSKISGIGKKPAASKARRKAR